MRTRDNDMTLRDYHDPDATGRARWLVKDDRRTRRANTQRHALRRAQA